MKISARLLFRLRSVFRRSTHEREMDDELRAHVDGLTERNIAAGMSPEAARHAALRTFGGVEQAKERCRDERGFIWLEQAHQDFSHACRALLRNRGFTFVAAGTLALGLGVNTALFTVFNAVALRPLPLKDPERLVEVQGRTAIGWGASFSYPDFLDLRAAQHGFDGMAAWLEHSLVLDSPDRRATSFYLRRETGQVSARVPVQFVSENFLPVLGAEFWLGRGFRAEENTTPGGHPVIVLQHRFWTEHFAADPDVVGQTLKLGQTAYTVIGVTAPTFVGKNPAPPIGWIPAMMLDADSVPLARRSSGPSKDTGPRRAVADRQSARFAVVARLQDGAAREAARAQLEVVVRQLAQQFPEKDRITRIELKGGTTFMAMTLNWRSIGGTSPVWLSFLCVLIIACANVANLLLARASTRQQEIGVRIALGATRGRIVRHLLAESTLIAVAGGIAGMLVTTWILQAVRARVLAIIPPSGQARNWQFLDLNPDYRVFAFTLALAFVAAVVAGLFPALLAARADVNASLKNGGGAFSGRSRARHGLVVAQVALSLTLLAVSGVLVRHVLHFTQLDAGLRTEHVFTGNIPQLLPLNLAQLDRSDRLEAIEAATTPAAQRHALETARVQPGMKAIALVHRTPFTGRMNVTAVKVKGADDEARAEIVKFNLVSEDYFRVVGLRPRRGRVFTAHEVGASTPVVVVSEATARRLWPGEDPVGQRLEIAANVLKGGWRDAAQTRSDPARAFLAYEVIGVVPDARSGWLWEADETMLYVPMPPSPGIARAALYQLTGPREAVLPLFWDSARAQGLGFGLSLNQSLEEWRKLQVLPFKGVAAVAASLGLLALLLSVVGLYGVMAFVVGQRVREIGIRVALGATAGRIVRLFVAQGMRLVGIGLLLGSAAALVVLLILSKVAVWARGFDPLPLACVALLLAAATLVACWLPARRATKVDPVIALRAE